MNVSKKFIACSVLAFFVPFFLCYQTNSSIWDREIRWDWNQIDLNDTGFWSSLQFPRPFVWGCATSAIQVEGVQTHGNNFVKNNWTQDPLIGSAFLNNRGMDHWNRSIQDVQLVADANFGAYRLSIPWEKIEPSMGVYDETAMHHYKELVAELKQRGIDPWICLFHFTIPVWFAAMGGFEHEKNLIHFVKFCEYVFDNLGKDVTFWAIYNEPIVYAVEGYFRGTFPPHIKSLAKAGTVMKNMLAAHVTIYQSFKQKNSNTQIGLIKMFHPLDPYNLLNPLDIAAAKLGNYLLHDTILNYFKTGNFDWFYLVSDHNKVAPKSLDFIGVNYYTHELVQCGPTVFRTIKMRPHELKVPDKKQGVYAEGLYRAIAKASTLNLPMYITENGIADSTDQLRNEFIKRHLYALQRAINDGYDVRGYFYWTLMDSLGWQKGYASKYGLYEVDQVTLNRKRRDGAQPFVLFLQSQRNCL